MDERIKRALCVATVFCIPLLCLPTGGVTSPLRFLFFPLILFLSHQLPSRTLLLAGVVYVAAFPLLTIPGRGFPPSLWAELAACLLSSSMAAFDSRRLQDMRERHDGAISAFHSLSDDLSHKNMNLQTTLDALSGAHQKLQEYDRQKTQLLSNVSHELRTPLSSIRSYSEILLNYNDIDNDTCREFIQIINTESERLSRLVNDVLDLTKMESGKVELAISHLSPASLLEESVKIILPMANDKGLNLRLQPCGELPQVQGDRHQIIQVLVNLLNNAVKFTSQGSIGVSAGRKDGFIEFSVTDTGEGIYPEEREIIFDEFYRICEAAGNRPKGTGLGLSISKKIVELLGGTIRVESEPGRGSTFSFTVPLAPVATSPRDERQAVIRDATMKEYRPILVLATDPTVRRSLRLKLEELGYHTVGGDTPKRAGQLIQDTRPALIVLNVSEEGEELAEIFRMARVSGLKVILVSLHVWNYGASPCLALHGYICKPFDKYQITSTLENAALHGGKITIFSPLQDEARSLQVLLSSSGFSAVIFSDGAHAIQSCINSPPDGVVIGTFTKPQIEAIVSGLKSTQRTVAVPLFLILEMTLQSHVKTVTLDRASQKSGRDSIYKLIGEIEASYSERLEA